MEASRRWSVLRRDDRHRHAVVHFENFDVPLRPEHACCAFYQVGEESDAKRGVRRAEHGHVLCRRRNPPAGEIVEARRSDENGNPCAYGPVEAGLQCRWRGEIHEHIAMLASDDTATAIISRPSSVFPIENTLARGLAFSSARMYW